VTILAKSTDAHSVSAAFGQIAKENRDAYWWKSFDIVSNGITTYLTDDGAIALRNAYLTAVSNNAERWRSTFVAVDKALQLMLNPHMLEH
jgi:hypothetical protein